MAVHNSVMDIFHCILCRQLHIKTIASSTIFIHNEIMGIHNENIDTHKKSMAVHN